MQKKIPVVVLFGPTASGKTKLAVELAKAFNGEVVTADSMQVYKGMDIGTAKPTEAETEGIPHHLIDLVEPNVNFSLAQYATAAHACIKAVAERGKLPVLAGGTGLYIDTVIQNITLSEEVRDTAYREQLLQISAAEGNGVLLEELRQVDAETAMRLHTNDTKRIVRALEVYRATGIPQSEHIRRSKETPSPYEPLKFCITAERSALYERINQRVELMFAQGLVQEVQGLVNRGIDERYTAIQGIGYKEVLAYFRGAYDLEACKAAIQQNTRRYAKRQVSWFKREQDTILLSMQDEKKLIKHEKKLKKHMEMCMNL